MEPREFWDRNSVLAEAFCASDEQVRYAQSVLDQAQAERSRTLAAFAVTVGSDGTIAALMGLNEREVRMARRTVGRGHARTVAEKLLAGAQQPRAQAVPQEPHPRRSSPAPAPHPPDPVPATPPLQAPPPQAAPVQPPPAQSPPATEPAPVHGHAYGPGSVLGASPETQIPRPREESPGASYTTATAAATTTTSATTSATAATAASATAHVATPATPQDPTTSTTGQGPGSDGAVTWSSSMDSVLLWSWKSGLDLQTVAAELGLDVRTLLLRVQVLADDGLLTPMVPAVPPGSPAGPPSGLLSDAVAPSADPARRSGRHRRHHEEAAYAAFFTPTTTTFPTYAP